MGKKSEVVVMPVRMSSLRALIDEFSEADKTEKSAKNRKESIKAEFKSKLVPKSFEGVALFNGENYAVEVAQKHSYSISEECVKDKPFMKKFRDGAYKNIECKHVLTIPDKAINQIKSMLELHGYTTLVDSIESSWVLTTDAAETRKSINESVEDDPIRNLIKDQTSLQFTPRLKRD